MDLGKQRLRQVLNLKMLWVGEELMAEMNELQVGTMNLDVVVCSLKFMNFTAIQLRRRDPEFSLEQAIDFMLRVFVEGRVRGKGTPLTVQKRKAYFQRIDSEPLYCTFTDRRLQFFRSFMGDMASPDRVVWKKEGSKLKSLPYSHLDQVTVRSSWWRTVSTTRNHLEMHYTIGLIANT
jgi:hypothetical protein